MIELTRTERITLLSLKEDDFIKDGAPKGITRNQYIVACKSLNKKGLARVAAVEGGDLEYAKLNTEGLALCDDLKELSNQTVSHDIPLSENALKVLELLCSDTSDNEIPEGMLECEYVDALRMLQDRGFITIGRSFNNYVISLQKNCIRDFNIIKKRRENNLTPLQAELLYKLSFLKRNETIDEIQTIEPFNELSDEEVYQSFNPLRTSGYIDFFGEDPALGMELPMYFKITNQGRNALRLYKEKHPEFHPRIENQNDPNNPYHLPDILNIPRANSIFNKAIEKGYLTFNGSYLMWNGITHDSSPTELAYFMYLVYANLKMNDDGSVSESVIPTKALADYFKEPNLGRLLAQSSQAKKEQPWKTIYKELVNNN